MKRLTLLAATIGLLSSLAWDSVPVVGENPPRPASAPAIPPGAGARPNNAAKNRRVVTKMDPEALKTYFAERAVKLEATLLPILDTELYFAIHACELSETDAQNFKSAAESNLTPLTQRLAPLIGTEIRLGQRITMFGTFSARQREWVLPASLIQAELLTIATEKLNPQQAARYAHEIEQRRTVHRRAIVSILVAKLDEPLALSVEQRTKLSETLFTHWQAAWEMNMWRARPNLFPDIYPETLQPVLDQSQRMLWYGFQKTRDSGATDKRFQVIFEDLPWNEVDSLPKAATPSK